MRKLIDQQQEVERIQNKLNEVFQYPKTEYAEGYVNACNAVIKMLDSLSFTQPEIIRCRDCKHWWFNYYEDVKTCSEHRNVDGTEQATKPEDYCSWAKKITDE